MPTFTRPHLPHFSQFLGEEPVIPEQLRRRHDIRATSKTFRFKYRTASWTQRLAPWVKHQGLVESVDLSGSVIPLHQLRVQAWIETVSIKLKSSWKHLKSIHQSFWQSLSSCQKNFQSCFWHLGAQILARTCISKIKILKNGTKTVTYNSLAELAHIHPNLMSSLHLDILMYQVSLWKMAHVNVDINHLARREDLNEED